MGKFQDRLDKAGHLVVTNRVHGWIAEFILEYSKAHQRFKSDVLTEWFGV